MGEVWASRVIKKRHSHILYYVYIIKHEGDISYIWYTYEITTLPFIDLEKGAGTHFKLQNYPVLIWKRIPLKFEPMMFKGHVSWPIYQATSQGIEVFYRPQFDHPCTWHLTSV